MSKSKIDQIIIPQADRDLTDKERLEMCNLEITEILNKYSCEIQASPQFTGEGRVIAVVRLAIRNL